MDSCMICANTYNEKGRKKITCNHCGKECCRNCIERYVLDSKSDVHCMYCKHVWDYKFIYENMTKSFIKKMRILKSKQLIQKEKILLPETQKYIEYDMYINNIETKIEKNTNKISKINDILKNIEMELPLKTCPNPNCNAMYVFHKDKYCYKCKYNICSHCRSIINEDQHVCNEEKKAKYEKYLEYSKERIYLYQTTDELKFKVSKWKMEFSSSDELKNFEHKVVCACVLNNCKGYITNKEYQCNLCNTKICMYCYNKLEPGHTCNKNDVKTVDVLKNSTKPCPNCSSLIQKIDGCNQMWCTNCNTAFGWVSGKIEKGAIHNPHYFEWFNSMEKQVSTNNNIHLNCDGIPEQRYFMTHIYLVSKSQDLHSYNILLLYFRLLLHINEFLSNEPIEQNEIKKNLDLRIQWVHNKIDDKKWSTMLYQREKKIQIAKVRNDVFNMFVVISSDICHKILASTEILYIKQYVCEWDNLIKYVNACFFKLRAIFNLHMPYISIESNYNFLLKMKYKYYN